jgi:hypothetical protein
MVIAPIAGPSGNIRLDLRRLALAADEAAAEDAVAGVDDAGLAWGWEGWVVEVDGGAFGCGDDRGRVGGVAGAEFYGAA